MRHPLSTIRTALAVLALTALAWSAVADETIIKSPNDDRAYAYFTLANGLQAIVISDPDADKAAASLDVNVGSGSDPRGREGLAHFLEHMLFLGTEKYPESGEYKDFMAAHGGGDNAYTSFDHTNYFFEVDAAFLEPALDRFAQFFIAPLFTANYVSRERQVVHSEYTSGLKSDGRRIHHAGKQALNPEHPAATFSVGTNETLADRAGDTVRDELLRFYREHYSAGLMTLAVIGREPLAVLRGWVESRFRAVPNTGAKRLRVAVPLFKADTLPARLDIVPVRDTRSLSFTFPIPPFAAHYRSKPLHIIGDLLGHEGPGSLLSVLKARGWVEALSAGGGQSHPDFATFSVRMQLTEAGLEHITEIGETMFAALRLIAAEGLQAWRFDELRRLADIGFRFQETIDAVPLVRGLANDMHEYPPADVLRSAYLMEHFEPDLSRGYLQRLAPSNVLVTVVAPGLATDRTTDRYEVDYRLAPLAPGTVARWSAPASVAALALPGPNDFIPEDLSVVAGGGRATVPRIVESEPGFTLWFQRDSEFAVPRTDFYVSVRSREALASPRNEVLTRLFVGLVNDELETFAYPAALAGMSYRLYHHLRGVTMRFSGYSDKEEKLLDKVFAAMASPRLAAERFAIAKSDLARSLRNREENAPYERALSATRDLLLDPNWTDEELLAALDGVDLAALRGFVPRFLARLDLVALAHGNLTATKASALAAIVRRHIVAGAQFEPVPRANVVALAPGSHYRKRIESDHSDEAIVMYFPGGGPSYRDRALTALLLQVSSTVFFDVIRTEKQLGYVVFATSMNLMEVPGLAFIVQSPTASAAELETHVRSFIADYTGSLNALDDVTLARHKAALVSRILAADEQLQDRSNYYWMEIDRSNAAFDTRERLAEAVQAIDLESLRRYYRERVAGTAAAQIVVDAGPARGPVPPPDGATLVTDATAFKQGRRTHAR